LSVLPRLNGDVGKPGALSIGPNLQRAKAAKLKNNQFFQLEETTAGNNTHMHHGVIPDQAPATLRAPGFGSRQPSIQAFPHAVRVARRRARVMGC
jgi:hypothetical protein